MSTFTGLVYYKDGKEIKKIPSTENNVDKLYIDYLLELQQENERLNNTINELEKCLKELKDCELKGTNKLNIVVEYIEDKLQELKESDKE